MATPATKQYNHKHFWIQIKELSEPSNLTAIESLIGIIEDPKERIALYRFTIRCLMFREWSGKS